MSSAAPANVHAQPASATLVEVDDVHFAYGERPVYRGVSVSIARGKVTAIMGPSGSGKSTLLSLIGGRERPARGSVRFDGVSVPDLNNKDLYAARMRMGMMFQASALLTDFSVFENVAFPLREHTRLSESLIRRLVLLKLQMVGLRGARDMMPAELSGGMARRVALARAIALDPAMVMYDEPFTGLDPISMGVTVKLIRQLNDALNITSVIVTHDVAEASSIADYVYVMGNGTVLGHGTPAEMAGSQVAEIRQFMDGMPDGPVPFHYPADDYVSDLLGAA